METTQTQISIHEQMFNCDTRDDKRNLLKELSQIAKMQIEAEGEEKRVNEVLIEWLTNDTHQEFNGFWQWKKLGFKVKKGEKAVFVWGKKREAVDRAKNENEEDKEFKFFPIAYLFSNAQVEPLKQKSDA